MTNNEWLRAAEELLVKESGTARLDAEVLLSDALGKNTAWLHAHGDGSIDIGLLKQLDGQLQRRVRHEPIAYIRGRQEFYGRDFMVNKYVLVPRPESETMIELALKYSDNPVAIADVGSGSGALGITLALELNLPLVDFYDIDSNTLKVAKINARSHNIEAGFYVSDLLSKANKPYDVVLANLPYVPDSHTINKAAMIEPAIAIFGGEDGLDLYRKLFEQLSAFTWKPQIVCTESLPFQHIELEKIAAEHKFKLTDESDFIQIFTPLE